MEKERIKFKYKNTKYKKEKEYKLLTKFCDPGLKRYR